MQKLDHKDEVLEHGVPEEDQHQEKVFEGVEEEEVSIVPGGQFDLLVQLPKVHEQLTFQVLLPAFLGLSVFGVHDEQFEVDDRDEGDDVEVDEGPSYAPDFLGVGEGPSSQHQPKLDAVEEQVEEEYV